MATRVILHLLGYNCNLYAGIGDQLKTLKVHEIGYRLTGYSYNLLGVVSA